MLAFLIIEHQHLGFKKWISFNDCLVRGCKSLLILTVKFLNDLLNQSNEKDQYEILLDFEEWLKTQE